jgi:WD40 repeat protein
MSDNSLLFWNWSNNSIVSSFDGVLSYPLSKGYTNLQFLNDGRVAGQGVDYFTIWSITNYTIFTSYTALALEDLNNGILVSAGASSFLRFWNATTRSLTNWFSVPIKQFSLKQILNSNYLASGSDNGTIFVWDTSSSLKVADLNGHTARVNLLEAAPNGLLLSSSFDRTVRLWNMTECLSVLNSPLGIGRSISAMKMISSNQFVLAGNSSSFLLVKIDSNNVLGMYQRIKLPVNSTIVNDLRVTSQRIIILAISDGTMAFFNISSNQFDQILTPSSPRIVSYFDIIGESFYSFTILINFYQKFFYFFL